MQIGIQVKVYLVRGPLFLPLSAQGFLTFAITITVAPLAEVTPALTKALVLASGCCDVGAPLMSVCFRLAGTVMLDRCCKFSLPLAGSFDGDGSMFLMSGSNVVEAPGPSLPVEADS